MIPFCLFMKVFFIWETLSRRKAECVITSPLTANKSVCRENWTHQLVSLTGCAGNSQVIICSLTALRLLFSPFLWIENLAMWARQYTRGSLETRRIQITPLTPKLRKLNDAVYNWCNVCYKNVEIFREITMALMVIMGIVLGLMGILRVSTGNRIVWWDDMWMIGNNKN